MIADWSTTLVFAATFLAVYVVYRSRDKCKYPPSLPWLPIVGSIPFLGSLNALPRMFMEKSSKMGNVFAFYAGSSYIVVINGRESIHEALVKRSTDFADRQALFLTIKYNLIIGLVFRSYDAVFKKFQHQSLSILKEFGFGKRIMESRISVEVSELVDLIKRKNGKPFDIHREMNSCIINVIYSILFGSRLELDDPKIINIFEVLTKLVVSLGPEIDILPILRFLPKYKRQIANVLALNQQFIDILNSSVDEALKNSEVESFAQMFLKGSESKRSDLAGILEDIFIGGAETTTTTLRWSLVMLANHPEIQDRLHKEIDSVVLRERFPSLDDKSKLPYVEASILEVMRLKTLLPLAVPHKTLCDTEVDGYFIPKGTKVLVNLYSAHMDPIVWKDPTVYRPERFLDNDGNIIGKELVISFSLGKRSCLGEQLARQELFLFFTGLLQHFEIRPPDGQEFIDDTENLLQTMFPSPFEVRLIPRSD